MNWSKAKNINIVTFLVLNILLLTVGYLNSRQYILDADSQMAITVVLERNNIFLDDAFAFARHEPKRQISLTDNGHNQNAITNILMRNNRNLSFSTVGDTVIFRNEYEQISFSESRIIYQNLGNRDVVITNENEGRMFSATIIRNLGEMGRYFELDARRNIEGGFILEYRESHRNNIIFSNYIIFTFKDDTIYRIDINHKTVGGFVGNPRNIRPPDEILLTFMRQTAGDTPVVVLDMDVVFQNSGGMGIPFYRIYYQIEEEVRIILINAYTNTL